MSSSCSRLWYLQRAGCARDESGVKVTDGEDGPIKGVSKIEREQSSGRRPGASQGGSVNGESTRPYLPSLPPSGFKRSWTAYFAEVYTMAIIEERTTAILPQFDTFLSNISPCLYVTDVAQMSLFGHASAAYGSSTTCGIISSRTLDLDREGENVQRKLTLPYVTPQSRRAAGSHHTQPSPRPGSSKHGHH